MDRLDGVDVKIIGMIVLLVAVVMILAMTGCTTVSTHFDEQIVEAPDGTVTTNTLYEAKSQAAPLGKLETTNHEWAYTWGGEENRIGTGQNAQGLDNSGQTVIVDLVRALLGELSRAYEVGQVQRTERAKIESTAPSTGPVVVDLGP